MLTRTQGSQISGDPLISGVVADAAVVTDVAVSELRSTEDRPISRAERKSARERDDSCS